MRILDRMFAKDDESTSTDNSPPQLVMDVSVTPIMGTIWITWIKHVASRLMTDHNAAHAQ
jgi:hypothetical protein